MEIANILIALSGDTGNTVPKHGVTAAEVAVLRVIHGDDAVSEIEIIGEAEDDGKPRTHRAERARLSERYGRQNEGRWASPAVDALFPGAAARVFETFDELDLPEELFKAERPTRATRASRKAEEPVAEKPAEKPAKGKKGAKAKAAEPAPEPEAPVDEPDADEDDGIGDMPDKDMFK